MTLRISLGPASEELSVPVGAALPHARRWGERCSESTGRRPSWRRARLRVWLDWIPPFIPVRLATAWYWGNGRETTRYFNRLRNPLTTFPVSSALCGVGLSASERILGVANQAPRCSFRCPVAAIAKRFSLEVAELEPAESGEGSSLPGLFSDGRIP